MQPQSFLSNLPLYFTVAAVFLLMISILVFAHELGHYLFARLFNMGVEEFAIGFGKRPLITYARRKYTVPVMPGEDATIGSAQPEGIANIGSKIEGGSRHFESIPVETPNGLELHETTDFTIRPLPFGGFVRIKGMLPEEDGSETKIPGGFYSKAPWKRFIVLLAGPAFSVLAGIAILVPVFMADGISRRDPRPILGAVTVKGPAWVAGLREGDTIVSLQGKPVTRFFDVLKVVRVSAGIDLAITYRRGDKEYSTVARPMLDEDPSPVWDENLNLTQDYKSQAKLLVAPKELIIHASVTAAVQEAVKAPIDTVVGLAGIAQKPERFSHSVNGPAQMVNITKFAMQQGVLRVMQLMAYLSISVGIFNLLPFPPLDGGQMAISLAEMFRGGRRLSIQIQGLVSTVGILAVVMLMFGALYVDFKQLTKPEMKMPVMQKKKL